MNKDELVYVLNVLVLALYTDRVSPNCKKPSDVDSGAKTRYFQCTFLNAGNSILGKMSNMQALSRSVAPLQIQPGN